MDHGEGIGTFREALEQLYVLHSCEIQELKTKLNIQAEQLKEKDKQLERMKEVVSQAKKKVAQQQNQIKELQWQLNQTHDSTTLQWSVNKTTVSLFGGSPLSTTEPSAYSSEHPIIGNNSEHAGNIQINDTTRLDIDESESDGESTDTSIEIIPDGSVSQGNSEPSVVGAPQTCVSLFGNSLKTSPGRPLQLKKNANGSNRIKYSSKSADPAASVYSNFNTKMSVSALSESELASPESNSPPFLGSTPLKSPTTPCQAGISVSMFHSAAKTDDRDSQFKTPPPGNRTNPIPLSDSQFSLDVSQSFPPSPELCGTSRSNKLGLQQSKLQNGRPYLPTSAHTDPPILKTPSIDHTTMIPVTPGLKTVQTILNKKSNSDYPQPIINCSVQNSNGATKGSKRCVSDGEENVPARKKQNLKNDHTESVLDHGDQDDPEIEDSPQLPFITKTTGDLTKKRDRLDDSEDITKARLVAQYNIPKYHCVTKILKKSDRAKLDGKACPECQQWYNGCDGIHKGEREHLKQTCRHKNFYPPPDTEPNIWNIPFPDTLECEQLMQKDH